MLTVELSKGNRIWFETESGVPNIEGGIESALFTVVSSCKIQEGGRDNSVSYSVNTYIYHLYYKQDVYVNLKI